MGQAPLPGPSFRAVALPHPSPYPEGVTRATRAGFFALSAALLPGTAAPCGTTGCVLAARGDAGALGRGRWRVDMTLRYLDQDRRIYESGSLRVDGNPVPPVLRPLVDDESGLLVNNYHQERSIRGRVAQADVSFGVTDRLTVIGSVPVFTEQRVEHGLNDAIHDPNHRDANTGTFASSLAASGIGDAQLNARYRIGRRISVSVGVQAPTGSDSLVDERGRRADPMLQPGKGAVAFVAGASLSGRVPRANTSWTLTGNFQRSTTSGRGYRFGDDAFAQVAVVRPLVKGLSAVLTLKTQATARNTFHGVRSASTGGRSVSLAPGLRWRARPRAEVFATVQTPLHQRVNEGQLSPHVVVTTGFALLSR